MPTFVVPGQPRGKGRARRGKGGHWYTPEATAEFEKRVVAYLRERHGAIIPWAGAIALTVTAFMQCRDIVNEGEPHTARPDASNILKAVEDALNGVAYIDDSQIASTACGKFWSTRPRTEITFERFG